MDIKQDWPAIQRIAVSSGKIRPNRGYRHLEGWDRNQKIILLVGDEKETLENIKASVSSYCLNHFLLPNLLPKHGYL